MEEKNKTKDQPPVENPVPEQTPIVTSVEKPKPKFKLSKIIAAVFGFLILVGGALATLIIINALGFSFPPISTANWKTYTNNTYHYSFQYPPGDTIEETVPGRFGSSVTISDDQGIINIGTNPINSPDFHKISGSSVNKKSFNGISWNISTTQGTNCSLGCLSHLPSTITYQTEKDENAYTFSYWYYGNKPLLYDAILSTFKFTDQTKTAISLNQELNNFPIYPTAIYTSKSINGSCLQQTLGGPDPDCIKEYIVYKFDLHEDEGTIMNWYNGKEFPNGWRCTVFGAKNKISEPWLSEEYSPTGHFTPYAYSYSDSSCSNKNLHFKLRILSNPTRIFVGIPE